MDYDFIDRILADIANFSMMNPVAHFNHGAEPTFADRLIDLALIPIEIALVGAVFFLTHKYFVVQYLRKAEKKRVGKERALTLEPPPSVLLKRIAAVNKVKVYVPEKQIELYEPNFNGDSYDILGVEREANTSLIVYAHHHWMKEFHPDKLVLCPPNEILDAQKKCKLLNQAKNYTLGIRKKSKAA